MKCGVSCTERPCGMQDAPALLTARADRSGSQTNRSSQHQDWPRLSVLSPRSRRQAVVTIELNPESQDRGLRQQVGRRRRAQARAAAYARWHHGPAPMAARPIPAALPTPSPTTLDGMGFNMYLRHVSACDISLMHSSIFQGY